MTLYVKGFKIDRQKVANVVGARDSVDHIVDTAIRFIMGQLNRSAYFNLRVPMGSAIWHSSML